MPSFIMESSETSNCRRHNDAFFERRYTSYKIFEMTNGHLTEATEVKLIQRELKDPTRDIHIIPGIMMNSLLSTSKCTDTNYITVLMKKRLIYMMQLTLKLKWKMGKFSEGGDAKTQDYGEYHFVKNVLDSNLETVIVNKLPTELLRNRPPPTKAVHNMCKLKTQEEIFRYLNMATNF